MVEVIYIQLTIEKHRFEEVLKPILPVQYLDKLISFGVITAGKKPSRSRVSSIWKEVILIQIISTHNQERTMTLRKLEPQLNEA
ncbi:uncharacterized protein LOC144307378 isoform X11 [Canis aureus]